MKPATNVSRRGLLAASSAAAFSAATGVAVAAPPRWRKIWNGVDLEGWTTWGGIPHKSHEGLGLKRNPDGTYAEPLGEGKDPRGVYSVVTLQGKRVLRISGELFGGMVSTESFSNYHLYVKWRWGDKRWEPRATAPRDSGILFHCTGELGASRPSHNWMKSIECQLQERDCGDLWLLAGTQAKSPARAVTEGGIPGLRFDPKAPLVEVPLDDGKQEPRVRRGTDQERPHGKWNVTEILVKEDSAQFKMNGKVVMSCAETRTLEDGVLRPLTKGRILLQSEGAEIFFAEVKMRPLSGMA